MKYSTIGNPSYCLMRFLFFPIFPCTVIELACGEHGKEKILTLVNGTQNGRSIQWFENADQLPPTSHVEGKLTYIIIK